MLGGEDDLAAVLSVLDRLSGDLEANRVALGQSLSVTDDIGRDIPMALVTPEKRAELTSKLREESQDCAYLRTSLDEIVRGVVEAAQLARETVEMRDAHTKEIYKDAASKLLHWQSDVEDVANDCAALAAAEAAIDKKLAKLLTELSQKT